jgi:hypothetical protein
MVLVDYIGIFFICGNTFGHLLYIVNNRLLRDHLHILTLTLCVLHELHPFDDCTNIPSLVNFNENNI